MKETRLFGLLPDSAVRGLLERAAELNLGAGETLFAAGEPSRGLYLVISGRTRALRHGIDGREQIMHEDGPGSTFPEVAVFDDGPYPSTVVAVEPTSLLFIPKTEVRRFLFSHPEVALAALELLSYRLRKATGMVEDFALKDVGQRLAEYLTQQSSLLCGRGDRSSFELAHTNQEIADLIGTVREVVSRSFSRLQRLGLIRKSARRVEILDPAGLVRYAAGMY